MSPVPPPQVNRPKTIQHFTHQAHPLTHLTNDPREFICDGCRMPGTAGSSRYHCNTCDFDLHEVCGECPSIVSTSFMHPQHQLSLVERKQGAQSERSCNVCGEQLNGLFLRCKICYFDVHPTCNKLPKTVKHGLHPHHGLTLQPLKTLQFHFCIICHLLVHKDWNYGCAPCGIHLHLNCATQPWPPQPPSIPTLLPQFPNFPSSNYAAASTGQSSATAAPAIGALGKVALQFASGVIGIPDFSSLL